MAATKNGAIRAFITPYYVRKNEIRYGLLTRTTVDVVKWANFAIDQNANQQVVNRWDIQVFVGMCEKLINEGKLQYNDAKTSITDVKSEQKSETFLLQ